MSVKIQVAGKTYCYHDGKACPCNKDAYCYAFGIPTTGGFRCSTDTKHRIDTCQRRWPDGVWENGGYVNLCDRDGKESLQVNGAPIDPPDAPGAKKEAGGAAKGEG